jgi:hypothetical protein
MNMTNMFIEDREHRQTSEAKGPVSGIDLRTRVKTTQRKVREARIELKKIFDHEDTLTKI